MPTKLDKILSALAEGDKLRSEIIRDTFHNNLRAEALNYLVAGCSRIYRRTEIRNGRQVEILSINPASVGKVTRQPVADTLPAQAPAKSSNRPERFAQFLATREAEDATPAPEAPPVRDDPADYDIDAPCDRQAKLPRVIRDHTGQHWLNDKAVKVERRDGKWYILGTDYLVEIVNGAAPENAFEQLSPFHADRMLERVTPTNVPLPMAPNPADLGLTPADLHYQKLRQQDRWLAAQGLATVERPASRPIHEPHCSRNFVGTASCDCKLGRGGA
jgi:hypothetical protein